MEKIKKLAIVTTHPIQYNAPFFKKLSEEKRIDINVFYTWDKGAGEKHDPGFGKKIEWDIPLLDGYAYTFVKNTSRKPGSHHFWGIQNPSLINEIRTYNPDAILVYGWSFLSHLQVIWYFKGKKKVWFRGDSTLIDEKSNIKTLFRRILLKWIYHHIDNAFYVGTQNKKYFLKHGLKEKQLIKMPHAIDNDFFMQNNNENNIKAKEWRNKLGIPNNDIVILFAGKFEPKKNPELLIDAFLKIELPSLKNNFHLILVGNGILEEKLKQKCLGNSMVHFLPFQNQTMMPIVYRLANIFCLPSKGPGESWGLALNEAMACNNQIIASDKVGGAIDLIKNEMIGYIFKNSSVEALTQVLQKTILQSNTYLNQKVIQEHINKFSMQKNVQILLNEMMKL